MEVSTHNTYLVLIVRPPLPIIGGTFKYIRIHLQGLISIHNFVIGEEKWSLVVKAS